MNEPEEALPKPARVSLLNTFTQPWFWYSIICVLCWGGWALLSKLGSREIPPDGMQFLFTIGTAPIALVLLIARRGSLEKSGKGIFYGISNGILSAVGGLALFAAYHTGGDTSLITCASALYPLITVLLAALVLRERLRGIQFVGLAFAAIAIIIFSL